MVAMITNGRGAAMHHTNRRIIGQTTAGTPIVWMRGAAGIDFLIDDGDSGGDAFDDDDDGDEDEADQENEQDEADQEGDQGEADDWSPPTRDEWEGMQRALKASTAQATERRKWLKKLGVNPRTGRPAAGQEQGTLEEHDDDVDQTDEQDETDTEQSGTREQQLVDALKVSCLQTELVRRGWCGDDEMVLRLVDLDRIELAEQDGKTTVTGLVEQIDAVQTKIPAWFAAGTGQRKTTPRRGGNVVDGGQRRAPKAPRTWREQLSKQMGAATGR
jgi:hypothetical protein